jgi:hypothetical protein
MELVYIVNRVSPHPRDVSVEYKGEQAKMTMVELEVEMYDPTGVHGTILMKFSGTTEVAAAAKFVGGATVTVPLDAFVVTPPTIASIETVMQEEVPTA